MADTDFIGLQAPFSKKFSKQWQYYLWLIVIARLLLPFSPKISLIETFMRQFETVKVQTISTETNTPDSFAISNAYKPQTHFQHIMSERAEITACENVKSVTPQ